MWKSFSFFTHLFLFCFFIIVSSRNPAGIELILVSEKWYESYINLATITKTAHSNRWLWEHIGNNALSLQLPKKQSWMARLISKFKFLIMTTSFLEQSLLLIYVNLFPNTFEWYFDLFHSLFSYTLAANLSAASALCCRHRITSECIVIFLIFILYCLGFEGPSPDSWTLNCDMTRRWLDSGQTGHFRHWPWPIT